MGGFMMIKIIWWQKKRDVWWFWMIFLTFFDKTHVYHPASFAMAKRDGSTQCYCLRVIFLIRNKTFLRVIERKRANPVSMIIFNKQTYNSNSYNDTVVIICSNNDHVQLLRFVRTNWLPVLLQMQRQIQIASMLKEVMQFQAAHDFLIRAIVKLHG